IKCFDVVISQREEMRTLSLSVSHGFSFNILCVGETSIGKSTSMNTLFNTTFESKEARCIYATEHTGYELVSNGVQIYQFPTDDEAVAEINSSMNAHLPFAVIGSSEEVKIGGRKMAVPMGSMENESHCDFVKLREMLIRVNMLDLREQTHARHCELYRRCKLEEMGFKDTDPDSEPFNLQETYVAKRRGFIGDLQLKEEQRRQMFVSKVKETEPLFCISSCMKDLRSWRRSLDFEEEMNTFNRRREAAETLQSFQGSSAFKKDVNLLFPFFPISTSETISSNLWYSHHL
uniref:Septin 8b n=1 Tax=Cyprinus carpio TaxID=7962 RepID=A0A8C2JAE5_CYPCA